MLSCRSARRLGDADTTLGAHRLVLKADKETALLIRGERPFLKEDAEQGSTEVAPSTGRVQEDILKEGTSDLSHRWE